MYLQFVVTHALSKQGELALWRPYTIYSPISSEAGMTPSFLQLIYQGRVVIPLFLPLEGPSKSRIISTTRVFILTVLDASRAAELARREEKED